MNTFSKKNVLYTELKYKTFRVICELPLKKQNEEKKMKLETEAEKKRNLKNK